MKQVEVVQSVDRALTILECLGQGQMSVQAISNKVELNKSTVHRLLQTLIFKGFVSQNVETSNYGLTPKLLQLGQKVIEDLEIIEVAKPEIQRLNGLTQEVVHLVMIEDEEAVYIDKIEAKNNIRMYSYIGKRIPLFSSAVGKAYLAFSKPGDLAPHWEAVVASLRPFTVNTLTTEDELCKDLEQIRNRGYSIDNEENELGVICVAAPIYNHQGNIKYAISVSTPKFRLTSGKLQEFGELVKETAYRISMLIGG